MMYIGTSLGGCLRSIMAGEVTEDQVMFIATQTMAPTFDQYIKVVTHYHGNGNPYSHNSGRYELGDYKLEDVTDLATRLWNWGKIHQPRVFVDQHSGGYRHPTSYNNEVWLEVMTPYAADNVAVTDAYSKYKMLRSLVHEEI